VILCVLTGCRERGDLLDRYLHRVSAHIGRGYGAQFGVIEQSGGYCWRTRKYRNLCIPHAFLEGKKAWETYAKKYYQTFEVDSPTVSGRLLYIIWSGAH